MSLTGVDKMPIALPFFRGMNGTEVKKLQMWLNEVNEIYGFNKINKTIPETGFFGDKTIQMLKEFQKFVILPPSGMYETKTHGLMEWKYQNMDEVMATLIKRRVERERQAAVMGDSRHW